ncbi:glycosyltransferase family 4 protein [Serinicoccus marinus]|uniref:glycosyltransferase family 4 protein n=1 Tax=Serinicoccus marinus TaxID=247333 RepID=UPI00042A456B|nr:glycosyltransferase family 4 protein [Serinicoccus marinus]
MGDVRILLATSLVAGGVGRHVRQLADGLVTEGHDVVVACPASVAEAFDMGGSGARVLEVEVGTTRPAQVPSAQRALRRVLRGADVAHAHGVRAGAALALAGLGRQPRPNLPSGPDQHRHLSPRPPLVVTSHNAPPPGRGAAAVYEVLERIVCHRADLVLTVSDDLADRARRRGARDVSAAVVPSGAAAVADDRTRQAAAGTLRAELGLAGAVPLVLTAGRLAEQKRVEAVIRAHHLIVTRGAPPSPRPVLVVVGDGPLEASLRAQAAAGPGEVRFLGRRDDVPRLLAGADVVVSAARWEGQPLVLQEALAAGAPVVATDVGGTAALLDGAGLLVPGEDGGDELADRLAAAVGSLLADPAARTTLTDRSRERAARLPTEQDALTAVLQAYRRVVGSTTGE